MVAAPASFPCLNLPGKTDWRQPRGLLHPGLPQWPISPTPKDHSRWPPMVNFADYIDCIMHTEENGNSLNAACFFRSRPSKRQVEEW
jgi:hypothetical protein